MELSELTKGVKVIIPRGVGYTDYTNGIERFCRALEPVHCTVVTTHSNDVFMVTDDNRKVHTQARLVNQE